MGVVTIKRAKRMLMTKKIKIKWRSIYASAFKTMAIMASCSFFIHMNVKEFK
jgi:hypothetical protein